MLRGKMSTPEDDEVWSILDRLIEMQPDRNNPDYPFGLNIPSADVYVLSSEHGRLMNGGLRYFFEFNPPGNMDYPSVAEVYRRIGAHNTARSIIVAAEMFPFQDPHLKSDYRSQFMHEEEQKLEELYRQTGEYRMLFEDLDSSIFDDEIDDKILAYMKSNLKLLPTR